MWNAEWRVNMSANHIFLYLAFFGNGEKKRELSEGTFVLWNASHAALLYIEMKKSNLIFNAGWLGHLED